MIIIDLLYFHNIEAFVKFVMSETERDKGTNSKKGTSDY